MKQPLSVLTEWEAASVLKLCSLRSLMTDDFLDILLNAHAWPLTCLLRKTKPALVTQDHKAFCDGESF